MGHNCGFPKFPSFPFPSFPKPGCSPFPYPSHPTVADPFTSANNSQNVASRFSGIIGQVQQGQQQGNVSQGEMAGFTQQASQFANSFEQAGQHGLSPFETFGLHRQLDGLQSQANQITGTRADGFGANPYIAATQNQQLGQIAQGVQNASLTPGEAGTALHHQHNVSAQASANEFNPNPYSRYMGDVSIAYQQHGVGQDLHRNTQDSEVGQHRFFPIPHGYGF